MPPRRRPPAGRARTPRAARTASTSLLVPVDRTETSATALVFAIELAHALRARLVLLTVLDRAAPDADREAATTYLDTIATGLGLQGIAHGVHVAAGDAAREIASVAAGERCELIVMTPHARPGGPATLLGSTAEHVIRSTTIPVMLVRPEHVQATLSYRANPPPFIVGLDGSALAAAAVEYAAAFARRLGSELVLVRAIEPALPLGGAASYYQSPSDIALSYLREIAEGLGQAGLKVSCEVLRGPAEREIVKAATGRPSAVVALCTRGYSGRKDWVLGSVTDRVVRSTPCPVLVIPPAAAE